MAYVPQIGCNLKSRIGRPDSYLYGQDSFAIVAALRNYTVLLVDVIEDPDLSRCLDSVGNSGQYFKSCISVHAYVCLYVL